jgi:predicted CXXCH cytochrome family protein
MLANIDRKSLLKVLAVSICSAIITLAALTASVSPESLPEPGDCLYSLQLATDPSLRADFLAKTGPLKGKICEINDIYMYTTDSNSGGAASISLNGSYTGIDSLSTDCLSCHDGVTAQSFKVRIKNNPNNRAMCLEDIIGGHPVGMEYDKYVAVNGNKYRCDVQFTREMIFAEGKVGCLTCHNPLNPDKGHLVINNSSSELCFACHNI